MTRSGGVSNNEDARLMQRAQDAFGFIVVGLEIPVTLPFVSAKTVSLFTGKRSDTAIVLYERATVEDADRQNDLLGFPRARKYNRFLYRGRAE